MSFGDSMPGFIFLVGSLTGILSSILPVLEMRKIFLKTSLERLGRREPESGLLCWISLFTFR